MQVTYIDVSRDEVILLAERLEIEPYPATCNIVLVKGSSLPSTDQILSKQIRLELAPSLPGVLLPQDTYSEYIDWSVNALISLAKIHNASKVLA